MISSLPDSALKTHVVSLIKLRMLAESQGLQSGSTFILKTDPGKLDFKRRESCIVFISLQDYDIVIDLRVDVMSWTTSFK